MIRLIINRIYILAYFSIPWRWSNGRRLSGFVTRYNIETPIFLSYIVVVGVLLCLIWCFIGKTESQC